MVKSAEEGSVAGISYARLKTVEIGIDCHWMPYFGHLAISIGERDHIVLTIGLFPPIGSET